MSSFIQMESRLSQFEPLLKSKAQTSVNGKQIRDLVEQSIRDIYIPELQSLETQMCSVEEDIIALASDYSGKYIILALASSKIRVIDVKTHTMICEIEDTGLIHQLFFLEESEMLYYYTYDASFYQMKAEFDGSICGLPTLIYEKKDAIYSLVEGTKLFAIAFAQTCQIQIFDTYNHKTETLGTFESEPLQMCTSLAQQLLFLLCVNKNFQVWSLKRGELVYEITFEELPLNFVANDKRLVLQYKRALTLFDLETYKFIKEIECNSNFFIFHKLFLANYLMIDQPKGNLVLLKMEDLEEECTVFKPKQNQEHISCIQRLAQSGNLENIYLVKNFRTLVKLVTARASQENSTIYKIEGQVKHIQMGEDGLSFSFSTSKGELYEASEDPTQCMVVEQVELEKGAPSIFIKKRNKDTDATQYYTFTRGEQEDDDFQKPKQRDSNLHFKYPRGLNYLRYDKTKTKRNSWLDARLIARQSVIFRPSIKSKTVEILSDENIRAMAMTEDQNYVVLGNEAGQIKLYDIKERKIIGVFGWHAGKVKNIVISTHFNKCFSSGHDGTIGVWDIPLPKIRANQEIAHNADSFLKGCHKKYKRNFKKQLKIRIRQNNEVHDTQNLSFEPDLKELLELSSLYVTWIELTPDSKYLIAGASSGHVLLWNVQGRQFQKVIAKHKHPVKRVALCSNRKAIISYDSGSIFIIDLTNEPQLCAQFMFHQSINVQAALLLEKGLIIIDMRGNVDFISITNEKLKIRVSQAFPVCFPVNYQSYTKLGKDTNLCQMHVVYSPDGKVEYFPSSFKKYGFRSDFCTWKRHLFLYKMKYERLNKNIKYFKGFETFLTQFSQFTMLHLYAYYSQIDLIREALPSAPILPESTLSISPLRVSLAINDIKAVNVFVNYLVTRDTQHFNDWGFLEKDLIQLNKVKFRNIHLIYQNLGTVPSLELPESGDLKGEDQLVILLGSNQLNNPIKIEESNANRLEWRLSRIPFEFSVGSKESLQFLQSMRESNNLQIFKSPFIQAYIQQKWKKLRKTMAIEAIFHSLFIAFLLETIIIGRMEHINLTLMLVFAILYLISQFFEFLMTTRVYFTQISNYNDIFGPLMMIYYYLSAKTYNDASLWCLSLLTLHAFFKGLTFFTLSKNLRFFIRFLKEILIDMVPFTLVLVFCTFLFSMTFISSSPEANINIFVQFFTMYRLNIGDFDTSDYSYLQMVLFIIVSWLTNIIMLNLIISLMGDTYDRVQTNKTASDQEELLEAIIEYENKFVWNRRGSMKKYILIAKPAGSFDEPDVIDWEGKVSILKYKIEEIGREMAEKQNATNNFLKKIALEVSNLALSQNKLKKERVQ